MSIETDFQEWWAQYPRKVGKLAAEREYARARKKGATVRDLLVGIARYVQMKPDYADYAHPRTFLSQGRWMDEADTQTTASDWRAECQIQHGGTCLKRWDHEVKMQARNDA